MEKLILLPDHFYNCPICGSTCDRETVDGWRTALQGHGACEVFSCINPLATDPLHYYNHIVQKDELNRIAYQEFVIDLETKHVVFGINLVTQQSIIRHAANSKPMEVPFVIVPDFPLLLSLKKKIKTVITFS